MARRRECDSPQLGRASVGTTIGNDDRAARNSPSQYPFHRARHRRAGLPCSDHLDVVEVGHLVTTPPGDQRAPVKLQMAQNRRIGIGGFQRRAKNLKSVFAHRATS